MVKFCNNCGTANPQDALFCAKCGSAIGLVPISLEPDKALVQNPPRTDTGPDDILNRDAIEKGENIKKTDAPKRNWLVLVAALGSIFVIGALYFWLFIMDDLRESSVDEVSGNTEAGVTLEAKQMFAMTEANIRDRATTSGSQILGKLPRGSAVTGVVKLGMDGTSEWLELSDGKGFIAVVNLADTQPPEIAKSLNGKIWVADSALDIWAQPDTGASLLDRVSAGTKLTLSGLTLNDYIEVRLGNGGFGYLANGATILSRLGGRPITIIFNPQSCSFGGELGTEFAKIGTRLKSQWTELENREFADEEARDKAYAAAESKSSYVKLQRSFEGLSLTAIAQHFESQSLYFSDPPEKVIDVFRKKGFRIGSDGAFPSTELYAGISATRGEGAAYGKTELGCGV